MALCVYVAEPQGPNTGSNMGLGITGQAFSKINICVNILSKVSKVEFIPCAAGLVLSVEGPASHLGSFLWRTLSPLDPKLRPSFQGAAGVRP